jgi:sugar lactone lactonase YvrE
MSDPAPGADAPLLPPGLRVVAEGLDHPECVCWSPSLGRVLAGGEAGQLYRFGLDGEVLELVAQVEGGFLCGVAADGDGNAYACDIHHGRVVRISPDGEVRPHGDAIGYPNYPVFGPDGTLWVSDSGTYAQGDGGIVRIDPDGAMERLPLPGLAFANGMALRGDRLYVVESQGPRVVAVPLAGGRPEPVVELPRTVPDGLAFDIDGGLWISYYQPNRIDRLDLGGGLRTVLDDWSGWEVAMPTNVAFAGPRLDVLVLANLGGWFVSAFDPGVRGAPLHYPRLAR